MLGHGAIAQAPVGAIQALHLLVSDPRYLAQALSRRFLAKIEGGRIYLARKQRDFTSH